MKKIVCVWFCMFVALIASETSLAASSAPVATVPEFQNQIVEIGDYAPAAAAGRKDATGGTGDLHLYPYNLHLTAGATSSQPLVIRDRSGVVQSGTLAFFNYNTSLISIDALGYVHALRVETSSEIGTWVNVEFNGQTIQNACVVRVLSQDYNWDYTEVVSENTVLYYPVSINGEDIQSLVELYQIPLIDEYAYDLEAEYMGLYPFDSARQIIELDFGESEMQRVCGISGNPFRLGWNIQGDVWRNCFLVPFMQPRSPQWFIFYHELAHNFTWPSYTFGEGLGRLVEYSEGIASVLAMATMDDIRANPTRYPIDSPADTSLGYVIHMQRWIFSSNFENWLTAGANFGDLNANNVDGIWMRYYDSAGVSFARRFFLPLQPRFQAEMTPLLDSILVNNYANSRHTLFAALVGAAFKQNLANVFLNDYHYPLIQPLHDYMYTTVLDIMNRAEFVCGDADGGGDIDIADAVYLVNYIFSGGTAPGPLASGDADCDDGITIADVVYLVSYIFSGGPAPCATCKGWEQKGR
jgi:hypothetical protein